MTDVALVATLARKFRLDVDGGTKTAAGATSTNSFTLTAHGLVDGQAIVFSTAPAGLTAGTTYYVINSTANTFKVSTTAGGTAATITADGSGTFTSWVQVRGLTDLKPTINASLQDDSDYDSDGWASQTKTRLAWMLDLKVVRKVAVAGGAEDPGQKILRLAGVNFGTAGVVHVRWYDRNGTGEAYAGFAEVSWSPDGGGTDALDTASVSLTGKGARQDIANPVAV
jgi:hypothetical protein